MAAAAAPPPPPAYGSAKLNASTTALDAIQRDLTGQVALVTGGASGIGVETVAALAAAGADVAICCRNAEAGEAAAAEIRARAGTRGAITVRALDLASLADVERCAAAALAELSRLDMLVLNAGVMACPAAKSADGYELQLATNHLGHFALAQRLLPLLEKSGSAADPARVVAVSSLAHQLGARTLDLDDLNYERRRYSAWAAYGASKLCNALFAAELARRCAARGARVAAFSLHPGSIATPLLRHQGWLAAPVSAVMNVLARVPFLNWAVTSPEQGAATSVLAASAPAGALPNGAYLSDCAVATPAAAARDAALAARLWEKTEELVAAAAAR
jgi:NAD(P)-dependent dehydrogenase (short-subunit alcohol dehydrogenase family)